MQENNIIMSIDTADFTANDYSVVELYKITNDGLIAHEQYAMMDTIEFERMVERIYNEYFPVTYFKNGIIYDK